MKRVLSLALVVVTVTLALTGCEWLLAPRVDDVDPADLSSYSASSTFAKDEDSVLSAMAFAGEGAAGGPAAVFDLKVVPELGYSVEGATFEAVFSGLVQHSIEAARSAALAPARSVTVSDDSDFSDPNNPEVDFTIEIANETVNGSDVGVGGSGTATVDSFSLAVSGSGTSTLSSASFEGSGEQNGVFTYSNWNDGYSPMTIHDGTVNSEGSGRVSVEVNETSTEVSGSLFWRFGYAMNAGLSVSNADTNEGGKIIVNFRYWGREDIDFDTAAELENQATGEFEAEMTIRVYDNSNKLVAEHTYTDDDVYETAFTF